MRIIQSRRSLTISSSLALMFVVLAIFTLRPGKSIATGLSNRLSRRADLPKGHPPPFSGEGSHDPKRLKTSQDDAAGSYSSSHGSQSGSQSSHGDEPKMDYAKTVEKGELAAKYMKSPAEDIVADLIQKKKVGKNYLLPSPFTSLDDFRKNGWEGEDTTSKNEFAVWVPFTSALKDLGLSDKAAPNGENEHWTYRHVLQWADPDDGEITEPVGEKASFGFVTNPQQGALVAQHAYSTSYWIEVLDLMEKEIYNPPLSRWSDMMFLAWKQACGKHDTELETLKCLKSLKHVFMSVITTPSTHDIVWEIFARLGRPLEDSRGDPAWDNLPPWEERVSFTDETEGGRALFATSQVQAIVWMLLQHRAGLGQKFIDKISVFKDAHPVEDQNQGPSMYIELKDVSEGEH